MTKIKALLVSTMDVASFQTPPNPVKNPYHTPKQSTQSNLESLLKLHEMGIISKAELRAKVLAWNPNPSPPTPQHSVTVSVNSPPSTLPAKRCREYVVVDEHQQQDENQQQQNHLKKNVSQANRSHRWRNFGRL